MDISSLTSAHMHTDDDEGDDEDHPRFDTVAPAAAASAEQSASVDMSQEPEQHDQDSDNDSDMSEHYLTHEHEQEHGHLHVYAAHNHNHSHPHRSLSPPRRSPSPIIALPTRRATMPRLAKTRASALASTSMHNGLDSHGDHLDSASSSALHLNGAGAEKGGDIVDGNGGESENDNDDATPDKSAKSASRVNGSTKGKGRAGNVPTNRSKVAIRAAKARAASKARNHQEAASDAAVTQDVQHQNDDDDEEEQAVAAEQNVSASTSLSGIASEVPALHRYPSPLRGDPISIKPKTKRLPSKAPRKSTAGAFREHTCEHCTKAFARKSDLIRHIRTHMGDKPFACACGKAFIQASALRVHERTHTGEKPYQCPHCTKCFADSSSLVRHKRVHTGERPYLCPVPGCGRSFCRNVTLLKHQLRQHGVEAMKQDGKPYLSLMGGTRPKRSHEEMAGDWEKDGDENGDKQEEGETSAHAIEPKIEVADDGLPVEEGSNAWYDDDSRGSYYAGGDDDADDADYGRTRRASKKKTKKPAAAKKRPAAKKSRISAGGTTRDLAAASLAAHPFSAATTAGGTQEGGSYPGSHAHSSAMVLDPYAYAAHPAYDGRFYYPHPGRQAGVPTMAGHPYAYVHAHAHAYAHEHAHTMQAAYAWGAVSGVAPPVTRNGTPASMASHRSRASLVEAAQAQQAAASGYPYGAAAISPGMTLGDTGGQAGTGGAAYGSQSAAASDVHMASAANSDAGGQTEAEMHYYARSQRPASLHLQIPFSATSPAAAGALIKPARSADPLKPSQSSQTPGSPDSVRSCVSAPEAAMVAAAAGHAEEKERPSSKTSDKHSTNTKSAGETLKAPAPTYDGQHQKQQPSFLAQAQQNHQHYRAVPAPLQVHPHPHAYAGPMSAQTPTVATPATYGSAHSPMAPLSAGQPGYAHPGLAHYASPHASSAAHYHYYGYAHPHMQQHQAAQHPHYSHYPHYTHMQHQEHLPTPGSAATSFFSGAQSTDHRSSITSASLVSPYQQQQVSTSAGAHIQPYGQQHQAYMHHYAPTQQYHAQAGQMYHPPASAAEAHAEQLQDGAVGAAAASAATAVDGQQYYHYPGPAILAQEAQSTSAQSYGSQEHPLMDAQASQQSMQSTYGKDPEQALLPAFDQQEQSSASLSEEARSNSQAGQSDHFTQNYTTAAIGQQSDGSMQFDPPFSASSHESGFPESDFLLAASRKASLASVGNASPFEPIFPMESTLGQTLVAGDDSL